LLLTVGACGSATATGTVPAGLETTSVTSNPGSQAISSSPTSTAGLPETVTASDIAITLNSVEATDGSTKFDLTIHLPTDIAQSAEPFVLGPIFATDVEVEGVSARTNDPRTSGPGHAPGQVNEPISLTYGPVTDPAKPLTLTLVRLRLSKTPTNPTTIQGPWVFQIAPQRDVAPSPSLQAPPAVSTLPTPRADGEIVLSFSQAQELASFTLVKPAWVPPYLTYRGVVVPEWNGAEPPGSLVEHIMFVFDPPNIYAQLSESSTYVPTAILGASTPTTKTIAGHSITRTDVTALNGTPMEYYRWQDQGTTFELTANITDPVTVDDLEHIIASMFDQ
jgi:hypothetical protein